MPFGLILAICIGFSFLLGLACGYQARVDFVEKQARKKVRK